MNILNPDLCEKLAKLFFSKCLPAPEEIFFLYVRPKDAKKSSLSWSKLNLKNKSLKYKESEEPTFEVSILGKKLKTHFSKNANSRHRR